MHEAKELLQFAVNNNLGQIYERFHREHAQLMESFDRKGKPFDFGPPPMIWSFRVWKALGSQRESPITGR